MITKDKKQANQTKAPLYWWLCLQNMQIVRLDKLAKTKQKSGSTEIWTRIAGFRVLSANRYTIEPCFPPKGMFYILEIVQLIGATGPTRYRQKSGCVESRLPPAATQKNNWPMTTDRFHSHRISVRLQSVITLGDSMSLITMLLLYYLYKWEIVGSR